MVEVTVRSSRFGVRGAGTANPHQSCSSFVVVLVLENNRSPFEVRRGAGTEARVNAPILLAPGYAG